ncbi:MAG: hypothetical protein D3919_00840 [Candidatus Electrothrix sp. AW5]|nr:hypothetical protein [Candidatus Electrothrix gigas]
MQVCHNRLFHVNLWSLSAVLLENSKPFYFLWKNISALIDIICLISYISELYIFKINKQMGHAIIKKDVIFHD